MTPERWQQIDRVLQEAMERSAGERAAFLDQACSGDPELREKVAALLAAHERAGSFIETPAMEVAARETAADTEHSRLGRHIGHYQVLSLIGAGGMGEVYHARDTKLDRTVALKMLPSQVAADEDRMRRFILEAKAASALNHPNVATIYEINEAGGAHFLAMEYVEGQSLAERIRNGPLDPGEVVEIGIQVADALDAAHDKGITHRDIKPANLMLTPRGQVKVLDFGLAKIRRTEDQAANRETATALGTTPGVVMGTVQYMSPEQVLGRTIDHRSDIFSLGVTMYEMATGRLPFAGATMTETMDQVLHGEPERVSITNQNAPQELDRIVRKCMEKERERRYQTARELLVDLNNLKRDSGAGVTVLEPIVPGATMLRRRFVFTALAVALTALGSLGAYLFLRDHAIDSLAVLPIVNESRDQESEYLSDGITESLINSLSRLPRLRVTPRTTAFAYKGKPVDLAGIGRELDVRAVLTGRLIQRGETLTMQVELNDVAGGRPNQLWGDRYIRKVADILQVQDDIARQIAESLSLRLSGEEQQLLAKHYTESAEAHQLYIKGRFFWNRFTSDGFTKAIEYFKLAVEKDPSYALAYAGLADGYGILGLNFVGQKDTPLAKSYAVRAVELDETLPDAHVSLGAIKHFYDWDFAGAEREFRRALELNPRFGLAHTLIGITHTALGRADEGIAASQRGVELDPLSAVATMDLANAYYFARRYQQAIEHALMTLEMDPNIAIGHLRLTHTYAQLGRYEEIIAQLTKVKHLTDNWAPLRAELAHAHAASGRREEARKILEELEERSSREFADPFFIALAYAGLGETDKVFQWLERAYEVRSGQMTTLKVEPRFDRLRGDPRFVGLLRRVGLPPP